MLCAQFLSSRWWAEKPPETCRALTVIKNIVQRCSLLVLLKNILKMHGPWTPNMFVSVHCLQHVNTHEQIKNYLTFFQVKGMPLGRRNLKLSVTDSPISASGLVPHTSRSLSPAARITIFSLKTMPNGKRRIRTEQGTGDSVSLSRFVRLFFRDLIYSWLSKSSLNLTWTFLASGTVVASSSTLMVNFVL